MADNKSTQKATTADDKQDPVELGQWEGVSERDRSKRRMSEGVRHELQVNGFAIDPATGDLLVSDNGGDNVKVVPRDKVGDEVKKRVKALEESRKPATPTGPGL